MYKHNGADYLRRVCMPDERADVLKNMIADITPHRRKFDAVVVRGISGALIGSMVASHFNKGILVCRKPQDEHHASDAFDGFTKMCGKVRYLFVDDLVATGQTALECYKIVRNNGDRISGMWMYSSGGEYSRNLVLDKIRTCYPNDAITDSLFRIFNRI